MGWFMDLKARERIDTLSRELSEVASELRILRLEWNETLDKLTRLHGRIAKREQLDQAARGDNGKGQYHELRSRSLRQPW